MKRLITVVFLMFMAVPAIAGISSTQISGAGWDNLTEEQKAQILQSVASTAKKNQTGPVDAKKVDQWVDLGERVGKMLAGTAKEVGVAVNEFVKTPVGKMTMAIVVWNYLGNVAVHVFGALLIWTIGFAFILFMLRRVRSTEITYDTDKTDIFGRARVSNIRRSSLDGDYAVGYTIAAAVVLGAGLITMFTF